MCPQPWGTLRQFFLIFVPLYLPNYNLYFRTIYCKHILLYTSFILCIKNTNFIREHCNKWQINISVSVSPPLPYYTRLQIGLIGGRAALFRQTWLSLHEASTLSQLSSAPCSATSLWFISRNFSYTVTHDWQLRVPRKLNAWLPWVTALARAWWAPWEASGRHLTLS